MVYISLGVGADTPLGKIHSALVAMKRWSVLQRGLPGHVAVYSVNCVGVVYVVMASGSVALPAGGNSLAGGADEYHRRGWQLRHLAGANHAGLGPFAAFARPRN